MNSTPTSDPETRVAESVDRPVRERKFEVLVFNRDPELRIFLNKALFLGNASVTSVQKEEDVEKRLGVGDVGLLLVGIDSPKAMEFLARVSQQRNSVPVVAVARTATPELVRDVMRLGIADFLFGSMDVRSVLPRLVSILDANSDSSSSCIESNQEIVTRAPDAIDPELSANVDDIPIVTQSASMKRIFEIVETVAPTESTILVQGESGTGKELIAKRIHRLSNRSDRPFVEVNCGAMPETLLESQLFGHEKGSFTGAVQRQMGLFEAADKSTIFLDEIGETSPDMQVKLLRVLQFREFRRIGGSQVVKVDVRVVAATNKDLKEEVEKGNFRADLFYRLNVICLEVPPLRNRPEEIPELVATFAERLAAERSLEPKTFTDDAVQQLQKYRWTGNVRELENAVERLLLLAKGRRVEGADVDEYLDGSLEPSEDAGFSPSLTLDEVKRLHIANVLRANEGNKMRTARVLKINVKTLYNLIKSLDIPTP